MNTKPILIVLPRFRLDQHIVNQIKESLKHLEDDYHILILDDNIDIEVISDPVLLDKLRKYQINDIKDLEL